MVWKHLPSRRGQHACMWFASRRQSKSMFRCFSWACVAADGCTGRAWLCLAVWGSRNCSGVSFAYLLQLDEPLQTLFPRVGHNVYATPSPQTLCPVKSVGQQTTRTVWLETTVYYYLHRPG